MTQMYAGSDRRGEGYGWEFESSAYDGQSLLAWQFRSDMRHLGRSMGLIVSMVGVLVFAIALYQLAAGGRQAAHAQTTLRHELRAAPAAARLPGGAIAELTIPRMGLDDIVVDGVSLADLAKGPGWYPTSAPVGDPGATAIAGHSSGWGHPFMHLGDVRTGDLIVLRVPGHLYTYRVTHTRTVGPDAVWVLLGDPLSAASHKLVLTTCTPVFTSRYRLVVFADLISASSIPA
jgi:sortase A